LKLSVIIVNWNTRELLAECLASVVREVSPQRDHCPSSEVWVVDNASTDGSAIRAYTYEDDLVDGIYLLMQSDMREPVTIGSSEFVTVVELVATVSKVSDKAIRIKHVNGPVGVQARILGKERIYALGFSAKYSFEEGIRRPYPWIAEQVNNIRTFAYTGMKA